MKKEVTLYMNKTINLILNSIENVIRYLVASMIVTMTVVIFYQVTQRYLFGQPTIWSEELARYLFVWLVMLASAIAIRKNRHIRIDFFIRKLKPKARLFIELLCYTLILVFLVFLLKEGWAIMQQTFNQRSPGLKIVMAYPYLSIPLGTSLMILFTLEIMIKQCKDYLNVSYRRKSSV